MSFAAAEKVRQIGDSFFHSGCFRCFRCAQDLSAADRVGCDVNGNILCELDFLQHFKTNHDHFGHQPINQQQCSDVSSDNSILEDKDDTLDDDIEEEEKATVKDKAGDDSDDKEELGNEDDDGKDANGKRKRGPKTTIKPPQLEILKTCFDQNPKPSPKIFGELAQDTGLTKRVIQVRHLSKMT
jgi:hypothetical protein